VRVLPQVSCQPHGAALLPAIVLMALVSILAVGVSWIGYASTARVQSQRDMGQAKYIADAMIDYARWILVTDQLGQAGGSALMDHLAEPWAIPIPHSRLQMLFGAEMSEEDKRVFGSATIAGAISDEQGKYNINTLFLPGSSEAQREEAADKLRTFCRLIGLSENATAALLKKAMDIHSRQKTSEETKGIEQISIPTAWYELQDWMRSFPNLSEEERSVLIKEMTWLPVTSRFNINTASKSRIAMLFEGTNIDLADTIFLRRSQIPFRMPSELTAVTPALVGLDFSQIDTRSDYFKVEGYAQYGLAEQSFIVLLHRQGAQVKLLDQWAP